MKWQAVPDAGIASAGEWRPLEPDVAKRCRRMTRRERCPNQAVAELNRERRLWRMRGSVTRPAWWAYCSEHLYGRWIEDGQVMTWVLRPIDR